jgi:hypothetical protein
MQVDLADYNKASRVENNSISYLPEKPKEDQLHLFPNPAGDYVIAYYDVESKVQDGSITINDVEGNLLRKYTIYVGKINSFLI